MKDDIIIIIIITIRWAVDMVAGMAIMAVAIIITGIEKIDVIGGEKSYHQVIYLKPN